MIFGFFTIQLSHGEGPKLSYEFSVYYKTENPWKRTRNIKVSLHEQSQVIFNFHCKFDTFKRPQIKILTKFCCFIPQRRISSKF